MKAQGSHDEMIKKKITCKSRSIFTWSLGRGAVRRRRNVACMQIMLFKVQTVVENVSDLRLRAGEKKRE